ncbi:MAG: penicillin-binding transpeptidase domain-containing protein [Acetobacter sp.]|nr:penicillin-binding transpeptidase domain-containing protein [Bacteroides sp.]MCM1341045.1 penicillin-binding transpeptidase domain-containing protein [Acetobacter sp.]MCM1432399.1 penicillin-binding transpeptidase domain-containing protein [Clostridiales bacterium]
MKSKYKSSRSTIALILIFSIIAGFAYNLYTIQIRDNEYYKSINNTVDTYVIPIEAARGEIVDRNGNSLVTNRQGNSIILNAIYFPSSEENNERNKVIFNLIKLFEHNKEEFVQNLPLKFSKSGKIRFTDDEQAITTMKSKDMLNLQPYATAQNCYDAVIEKYGIEGYDAKTSLKIANIRYELTRLLFSYENPVTIADDVSDKTVAQIKEDHTSYLGADVKVVAYREYTDSTIAPHILGTVRKINAEEYEENKDNGYKITDQIGESGIERAMESELKGTAGELTVTIDNDGNVTETVTKKPVQGNTIVLTIDRDLQVLAQNNLEKVCNKVDRYSSAGAVVVTDCNNGDLLAAASYPTFDLKDYYDKYKELSTDSRNPLWSRFAMATYAPGSTFKPVTATAAMEEGVIDSDSTYVCEGSKEFFGQPFKCLRSTAHGTENVRTALRDSCNMFFYNCALDTGIDKIDEYASAYGLGQKTGVEIAESSGNLSSPDNRRKAGGEWRIGDTMLTAIGMSDNLFTPLQLANYCSTIANGGTRYELHFVKSVIKSSSGIVDEKEVSIEESMDLSENTLSNIYKGMRLVATNGGPSLIYNALSTQVACKTGTSEVIVNGRKRNNGFLITYAPYKNPEIAISSVVELAGSGSETAEMTSEIIKYWYQNNTDAKENQKVGTLLP